jgi:hypothetical protein
VTPLALLAAVEAPLLAACLVTWAEAAARDYRAGATGDRAQLTDGWETPWQGSSELESLPRRRWSP